MIDPNLIFEYANKKEWFNVGVTYIHREDLTEELRTAYFRGRTVQEALKYFDEKCEGNDQIITCWLFDEGDIEECYQ